MNVNQLDLCCPMRYDLSPPVSTLTTAFVPLSVGQSRVVTYKYPSSSMPRVSGHSMVTLSWASMVRWGDVNEVPE